MWNAKRLSASVFFLALFLAAGVAKALPISDVIFSRDTGTGPTLERVGFDGTTFIGGATLLEELNPGWTSMSYDATAGFMYFTRASGTASRLERVGFDGNGFTGGATVLEELNPEWMSMSYDATAGFMYFTRVSGTTSRLERVGFDGTGFVGGATVLEELNPEWTSMSYDSTAGFLYFTRASGTTSRLERVGFDGTGFTGGATVLEELNPEWTAMSLVYREAPVAVTEPGTISLFAVGLLLSVVARANRKKGSGPGSRQSVGRLRQVRVMQPRSLDNRLSASCGH
ncbi:hypothetical protein [Marinobacter daqiaonensis]|nr:hypothetical protein [Marinobacter daqiaonensis]